MRGSLAFGADDHTYWTASWSGRLRFAPNWTSFPKEPEYVLARGSTVSWSLSGSDQDCSYAGGGSLDVTKLQGTLSVGAQVQEGLWQYAIEVRAADSPDGEPLMPIAQTCDGETTVLDAATTHGRFPFVVSGIFGQVAVRNEQSNTVVFDGDARERGSRWAWRVAGPVFADQVSQHGIDFIKDWELLWQPCRQDGTRWTNLGKRPTAAYGFVCAYDDTSGKPNCTIGYGRLLHHGRCTAADNRLRWTPKQAEDDLYNAVKQRGYEALVRAFSRKYGLNQCQFDALTGFAYNAGARGFRFLTGPPSATDLGFKPAAKLPMQGWESLIGQRLTRYIHAGGKVLPGLVRRRMAEFILFMTAKCPCQGVAAPRTDDKRIPKIEIDPCKPPKGYEKAKYCPR